MTDHTDYSEALWLKDAPEDLWRRFMAHDHLNPSRYLAFYLIAEHFWQQQKQMTLAEIGFGDCCDFRWAFKHMHDRGVIAYTGYEIMGPFVQNALSDFWGYQWRHGGFMELEPMSYDITYARHVFEHIHPMLWRKCLVRMLKATKELAVVTWYMPPCDTRLMAKNWTGEGWQNQYYRKDVTCIVDALDFSVEMWPVRGGNEIWAMERM